MTPDFAQDLEKVGRRVLRWRAQAIAVRALAALLLAVVVFGALDFALQLDRPGRAVTAILLLAGAAFGAWGMGRILRARISAQGAAAMVEHAFPELDNRLINHLQFAPAAASDPFAAAYVQQGAPSWRSLPLTRLRDERAHRRGWAALAIALVLLAAPMLFIGKAWPVALWRAVNPFASTPPLTLTRIVRIEPGDTTALQGKPVLLSCAVEGFTGHEVKVDLHPVDAERTTIALGKIEGAGEQVFSRRIPSLTTGMRYRFRAGDAPASDWHTVGLRAPPALTGVALEIAPPAHTRRPGAKWTPAQGDLQVIQGSTVTCKASGNTALASLLLTVPGQPPVAMTPAEGAKEWTASVVLAEGQGFKLEAKDPHGDGFTEEIAYHLVPDQKPSVEVTAPSGRVVLPAGETPRIEFSAQDDFGLARVWLERIDPAAADDAPGTVVKEWTPGQKPGLREIWKGDESMREGGEVVFRVCAGDNRPDGAGVTRSGRVVFQSPTAEELAAEREKMEQQAESGLKQVVELQRQALGEARHHRAAEDLGTREQWSATADVQKRVRELTRELLGNPLKPLGFTADNVRKLYLNEMIGAQEAIAEIPGTAAEARGARIDGLVRTQEKILKGLAAASEAAGGAQTARRLSDLSSSLERLIREQGALIKAVQTLDAAKTAPAAKVVDEQDRLASAVTTFRNECAKEAAAVKVNDAAFSAVLEDLAAKCDTLKIREDMTLAAERLDGKKTAEALPLQEKALASLKSLDSAFSEVRMQAEEEKREAMVTAAAQASEKIGKIKELHERMLAAMDAVRGQKDKDSEAVDLLQTAFEEMIKNTKEALLEVPNDLHVFMDLNVANELVEDVMSIYEEVEQVAESKEYTDKDFIEAAYAKEEVVLEMMESMEGRIDDMEKWLDDEADRDKVTTEAYDQEEMPAAGMALGALATKVEDLISDLLEEPEDLKEAATDASTNHGLPDMEGIGWKVEEGNIATFAGKGVSGSQTPEHKEQDGRSNVGRQGMSSGETSAGSGTINKGDDDIEARRTEDPVQSGQVDLDGEADTNATGGGKLGTGKADGKGMGGGAKRLDSTEEGSSEGMAALMARQADAVYAQASLKNMRVDSLKDAAHHIRQSGDAVARGEIGQAKEFRQLAVGALRKAQVDLAEGPTGVVELEATPNLLKDMVEGGPDMAPAEYRDSVSEYYKVLNESL